MREFKDNNPAHDPKMGTIIFIFFFRKWSNIKFLKAIGQSKGYK